LGGKDVSLAEIYYRMKNRSRASSLLKDVFALEKNNQRAKTLSSIINGEKD